MITYFAGRDTSQTKYHLRRLNYLNTLTWDEELEYLAVYVNRREVEFNIWNDGSLIQLVKQPQIGDKVEIVVEDIIFLEDAEDIEAPTS